MLGFLMSIFPICINTWLGVKSVPIILLMVLAIGLRALIGRFERLVAPWQDEIAGRDQN